MKNYAIRTNAEPEYISQLVDSEISADLHEGEVLVEVQYSSVNFKDALAVTGKGKILKSFPLTPGIDVAGRVYQSNSPHWNKGQEIFATGCGLGEHIDGGFARFAKVSDKWAIAPSEGLSLLEAMSLGTAGFTAAICVHRLLTNGQTPDKGPMLVTGASGGVGMISIDILSKLGFEVWAVSGKESQRDFLQSLGAAKVLSVDDLQLGTRALESVRFGGAVDNVGGAVLEGLLRHTQLWGNIASVGLAMGANISGTVMPHILRGVSLLGISSGNCPEGLRHELWKKLAGEYKPSHLAEIASGRIGLDEVIEFSNKMLARETVGRTVVEVDR